MNNLRKVPKMYWICWLEAALYLGLTICVLLRAMGVAG